MFVYTDGACKGNPGIGGWGVFIIDNNNITNEFYGYQLNTTNNRMELFAIIIALEKIKNIKNFDSTIIYTDSQYAYNGINKWIKNWKKNNWTISNNKNVLNKDLWLKIDALLTPLITINWIKAHDGNFGNEKADFLANFSIKNKICKI